MNRTLMDKMEGIEKKIGNMIYEKKEEEIKEEEKEDDMKEDEMKEEEEEEEVMNDSELYEEDEMSNE